MDCGFIFISLKIDRILIGYTDQDILGKHNDKLTFCMFKYWLALFVFASLTFQLLIDQQLSIQYKVVM